MEAENNLSKHSVKVICEIPMRLPSLNEYINACRANRFQGSKMKKQLESEIGIFIARLPEFEHPVRIHFHWIEENQRRDLDNICFAKKFILDSMVKHGKLMDDNRKNVCDFHDHFFYSKEKEFKVILKITEAEHGAERIWDDSILGE